MQWACHFDIARRKALKAVVSGMMPTEYVLFVRQVRALVNHFAAIASGPLIEGIGGNRQLWSVKHSRSAVCQSGWLTPQSR